MIPPGPVYDQFNEAQHRRSIQIAIDKAVTPDRALNHLLIADTDDGSVYMLTVASGVLTITAV